MKKTLSEAFPKSKIFSRSKLFPTKTLDQCMEDSERPEYQLKRVLGPFQLILFGIGAIIGAGIFATIGTAAACDAYRPGAGPALMVSFVITAIVCSFTALCYAEFTSIVPISGSAYTYSYATLGEIVAWIIGWDLIIEYAVGNIAVAISWANYFKTFLKGFNIIVPDWLSMDYRTAAKIVDSEGVKIVYRDAPHIFGVPIIFNVLAVGIVAVITLILVWGIRESARFNAYMVGIKIVVLKTFSRVHKRFRTPHVATILTGVFVAVFAAVASIDEMVDLTNIGTLFAFILVCAGIIVLRKTDPDRPRPFKVPSGWLWSGIMFAALTVAMIFFIPGSPITKIIVLAAATVGFSLFRNYLFPVLGILSCLYLIFYLPPTSWLRFAAWPTRPGWESFSS